MFRLQIDAPCHRVLELLAGLQQQIHGFRVSHTTEIGICDVVQTIQQTLVHEAVEELHLFRRILQHVVDDILDHGFCHFHVPSQIREGHFRFNHPEFGSMPCRVGVFRTEGRSEGIDIPECQCKGLCFQLSADGQVSLLAEEVLAVIDGSVFCPRQIFQRQGGNAEHFPCTFTVAACNDRSMHINEVLFLEELVDGIGHQGTNPEYRREGIASRS